MSTIGRRRAFDSVFAHYRLRTRTKPDPILVDATAAAAMLSILLLSLFGAGGATSRASEKAPRSTSPREGRINSMADETMMRELFDRWERVWHEGQYDLIPSCVAKPIFDMTKRVIAQ